MGNRVVGRIVREADGQEDETGDDTMGLPIVVAPVPVSDIQAVNVTGGRACIVVPLPCGVGISISRDGCIVGVGTPSHVGQMARAWAGLDRDPPAKTTTADARGVGDGPSDAWKLPLFKLCEAIEAVAEFRDEDALQVVRKLRTMLNNRRAGHEGAAGT